ncbi:cyclic nucleotide-binding domain-containing protein [Roseovarius ramblicola]|uniref:Cyclic nucleotide-binding domain-containing protein n=1 Tax=Roseovarius ramblicola TaxID=2022336 RepID=A0ABV5HY65_9RHOB
MYDWAGYLGVAIYLGAYICLQLGYIRGSGYRYASLNMVAAICVLVSLSANFNLASAIIQGSWVLISLVGITRVFLQNHRLRFTEEEADLLSHGLPTMPRAMARRFLDTGVWRDARPGVDLTREGEEVAQLHFIRDGLAGVYLGGSKVAEIREGFVGEMNVMEPGPASATVRIEAGARVFSVSGDALRRISRTDSEFRAFLEQNLNAAVKRKLIEANTRMTSKPAAE